jgi:hypothetical protein
VKTPRFLQVGSLLLFIGVGVGKFGLVAQPVSTLPSDATDSVIVTPRLFAPHVVSTGDYESEPQFSPDGKKLYFIKSTPDFNFWTIVQTDLHDGQWSTPVVAPFSGQYSDADPTITADGKFFYFVSRRPVDSAISPNAPGRLDIYRMTWADTRWGPPVNVGPPVNSESSEFFPSVASNGSLYFGSGRKGGKGGIDLYRSRLIDGKYVAPENLGDSINTPGDEFEGFVAPDESYIIFMAAARADGLGGFDLYVSYNIDGHWTRGRNLGAPINSSGDELGARVTPDGRFLFWSSTRSAIDTPKSHPLSYDEFQHQYHGPQNGLGDIYFIDLQAIGILRKN